MLFKGALILALIPFVLCNDRTVTSYLNYECDDCLSNITHIYVKSVGNRDIIHQTWDFIEKPILTYSITSLNNTLHIKWAKGKPELYNFTEEPYYSFAIIFDNIVEYNDVKDIGKFDPNSNTQRVKLDAKKFIWNRTNFTNSTDRVMLEMTGEWKHRDERNGTVTITLNVIPKTAYSLDLPHLIHNANTTQVDAEITNLTTTKGFNSSRFAYELTFYSTDSKYSKMSATMRKSLDDEHTPGIFEVMEFLTPESVNYKDGGFMQYRPIAYLTKARSIQDSTLVTHSDFRDDPDKHETLKQNIIIMFGSPGDKFFEATKYLEWSFNMGYGLPPKEQVSMFVRLVIGIGLAIPAIILISGISYICCKRRQSMAGMHRL